MTSSAGRRSDGGIVRRTLRMDFRADALDVDAVANLPALGLLGIGLRLSP